MPEFPPAGDAPFARIVPNRAVASRVTTEPRVCVRGLTYTIATLVGSRRPFSGECHGLEKAGRRVKSIRRH